MIFFLFHIEIEGKCGWIIGGGAFHIEIEGKYGWIIGVGGKRYVAPPSQVIGGLPPLTPPPRPPLITPMCFQMQYTDLLMLLKLSELNCHYIDVQLNFVFLLSEVYLYGTPYYCIFI